MRLGPERKFPFGQDATFLFVFADGYPTANPTLSVQFAAGTWTGTLQPIRAADTVTGINADLTRLTISTAGTQAASIIGQPGDYGGAAWLVGPGFTGPVKVQRLYSDASGAGVVELAEPLPHDATWLATTTLRWVTYYVTIPAATIGAAKQRFVRWSLPWTRSQGSSLTTEIRVEHGILHVVRNPFDTGLTDQDLRTLCPDIMGMVPGGQETWHPQREAAHDELVRWVRAGVPEGRHEDQAPGSIFREVHAQLTGARVFEGKAAEGYPGAAATAERMRARAREEFERIIARPTWLDADDDGEVDTSEIEPTGGGTVTGAFKSDVTNAVLRTIDDPSSPVVPDLHSIGDDR